MATLLSEIDKNKMYDKAKKYAEQAYEMGNSSDTKQLLNKIDSVLTQNQVLKIDSLK